jgi:hypothetical protein
MIAALLIRTKHEGPLSATRGELRALATSLRHAPTRHLPMDVVERIQHTLVKIEELLAAPVAEPAEAQSLYAAGKQLLDYCNQFVAKL